MEMQTLYDYLRIYAARELGRRIVETYSSSEITRDVYLHSVPADSRRAVQGVEDLIGPKWTQVPVWPEPVTNVTQ